MTSPRAKSATLKIYLPRRPLASFALAGSAFLAAAMSMQHEVSRPICRDAALVAQDDWRKN